MFIDRRDPREPRYGHPLFSDHNIFARLHLAGGATEVERTTSWVLGLLGFDQVAAPEFQSASDSVVRAAE